MTTYTNFENFLNWYNENAKIKTTDINIDALKNEIENQVAASGKARYELSRHESISGNPCECDFEADYITDEDGDIIETVFTF